MSSRRRGGRGAKQKLAKLVKEQKKLEDELVQLNDSQDPEASCKEIIQFLARNETNQPEPMKLDDNPFKINNNRGFCIIL